MADVTARSLQYEYKAVSAASGLPRLTGAVNPGGAACPRPSGALPGPGAFQTPFLRVFPGLRVK